jgi:hypothetical protein
MALSTDCCDTELVMLSFIMLSVANKTFMLRFVVLNVAAL